VGRDTEIGRERDDSEARAGLHLVIQLPRLELVGPYINIWGRAEMETGVNDERVLSRR